MIVAFFFEDASILVARSRANQSPARGCKWENPNLNNSYNSLHRQGEAGSSGQAKRAHHESDDEEKSEEERAPRKKQVRAIATRKY